MGRPNSNFTLHRRSLSLCIQLAFLFLDTGSANEPLSLHGCSLYLLGRSWPSLDHWQVPMITVGNTSIVFRMTRVSGASEYLSGRPFYVNPDYTASHTSFADAHSQCGSGELYCWISPFHKDARLPLHFLWILITAISSCICYPILFWFIHKGQYIFRSAVSIDSTHSSPSFNSDLDTVALRMLLFPILFCANNILLICYRLADMAGHKWSQGLLVVGVCVYALSGLCDTLLYGITRKVITTPARSTNSPTSLNRPAHVDIPHRTPSKSASPHTPRQMEFGATTEDIDLEAHWKEKPSISYETIELNQYDALEAPLWGPR